MPWLPNDVDRHFKGLSSKEKRQWCHIANGCLEKGQDDGIACHTANGVIKNQRIRHAVESLLYRKCGQVVETARMQEMAAIFENENPNLTWLIEDKQLLICSDPKPRVEKDINGKPVVPQRQQYVAYFQDMQAGHIADQLRSAQERWATANAAAEQARAAYEKSKSKSNADTAQHAAAVVRALGIETSVANSVLKTQQTKVKKAGRVVAKKVKGQNKAIQTTVTGVVGGLLGGSKLAKGIVKHVTNFALQNRLKNKMPKVPQMPAIGKFRKESEWKVDSPAYDLKKVYPGYQPDDKIPY